VSEPVSIIREFDPKKVPREDWAAAVSYVLWTGFKQHPEMLHELLALGENVFVRRSLRVDTLGLHKKDYREIFRFLERRAQGLPTGH
jgi:hypothetical protein